MGPGREEEKERIREAVLDPEGFVYVQNAVRDCLIRKVLNAQLLNALIADIR